MVHVDLPLVHELDETLDVHVLHVLHDQYRVLLLVLGEDGLEVGAAGGQHDLVRLYRPALAGKGDVAEGLSLEQLGEHGLQVGMMVPPPEAVLLGQHVYTRENE